MRSRERGAVAEISVLFPPDAEEAATLLEACLPGAGVVAEEKLFDVGLGGEPRALAARVEHELAGLAVTSGRYLRLLVVAESSRGVGVGGSLLEAAIADISSRGHDRARLAAEPGNYLAPGIEDGPTIDWFGRRGFVRAGESTNLLVDLANNTAVSRAHCDALAARCRERGYSTARAARDDRDALIALARESGEAWAIEVERAMSGRRGDVHIARAADGALVAFAAHDGNNRGLGWFGPAATREAHRGNGLGEALLVACLVDVADAGHSVANIAWIGPREFYQRAVGIAGERTFVNMEKAL